MEPDQLLGDVGAARQKGDLLRQAALFQDPAPVHQRRHPLLDPARVRLRKSAGILLNPPRGAANRLQTDLEILRQPQSFRGPHGVVCVERLAQGPGQESRRGAVGQRRRRLDHDHSGQRQNRLQPHDPLQTELLFEGGHAPQVFADKSLVDHHLRGRRAGRNDGHRDVDARARHTLLHFGAQAGLQEGDLARQLHLHVQEPVVDPFQLHLRADAVALGGPLAEARHAFDLETIPIGAHPASIRSGPRLTPRASGRGRRSYPRRPRRLCRWHPDGPASNARRKGHGASSPLRRDW